MRTSGVDYAAFDALTFDCYGTLIDWETGLGDALRTALAPLGVDGRRGGAPRPLRRL